MDPEQRLAELDALYVKARQVATDLMGYPATEEDEKAIQSATPMQAIEALEKQINRLTSIERIP